MKSLALILAASSVLAAQQPAAKGASSEPQVSTTTKIALESIADKRQQLYQQLATLQQQEISIEREFTETHPGWVIDPEALRKNVLSVKKAEDEKAKPKAK